MALKVVTWNINGIRPRTENLCRFLSEYQPDIICLQEIKIQTEDFPGDPFRELGYEHQAIAGQKAYHGVAILSKIPFQDQFSCPWGGEGDARHVAVNLANGLEVHSIYIPAGGDKPDPEVNVKFDHKLRFWKDMTDWFAKERSQDQMILAGGDFNVAPLETDVWNHKRLVKSVGHSPVEVEHLEAAKASLDWTDLPREYVPSDQFLYSWWGYRYKLAVEKDYGWRLDHSWATPALKEKVTNSQIIKPPRLWERPSDHVPIMTEISL
jgi:exodeoxyribonuclease III